MTDAGYENFANYSFLDKNNYEAYIKPTYYKQSKTRKFKSDLNRLELIYDEEKNTLNRREGIEFEFLYEKIDYKYFKIPY